MLRLFLPLFVMLVLSSCGAGDNGGGGAPVSGATNVSISLGQSVVAGAVSTAGIVPQNILSMSVTAFNSSGQVIAGPVFANAPSLTVNITVPNGTGIRFQILAFSAQNGSGAELHRGEVTADLTGGAVTLPVKMNLTVAITPAQSSVQRGQTLALTASVSGSAPSATSPLLWQATAGALQALDIYGSSASWIAPNSPGVVTIDARIDPTKNPDQHVNFFGSSTITVLNQSPLAVDDYTGAVGTTPVTVSVLLNDSDPENDTISISGTTQGVQGRVVANANGTLTYTANATATGRDQFNYTIRDVFGASATATVFVILNDVLAPVIVAPSAITVEATTGAGIAASNIAIQNFLNSVTATDNVAVASLVNNALAQLPLATTVITFTATDAVGNQSVLNSSITVVDTTAPTVTAPADVYTQAIAARTSLTLISATANDLVDVAPTITNNAPATFPVGTTLVVWTATDLYGNSASATQKIQLSDQQAPVITAPTAVTVAAINASGTPVSDTVVQAFLAAVAAVDNVDTGLTINNDAPALLPLGASTITFSSIDTAGNSGTATAVINIIDQSPPIVTVPANITVFAVDAYGTPVTDAAIATFLAAASAKDNVDSIVTVSNNAATLFPIGATTVTFTSVDAAQNSASATAVVTVQVASAPVVTAPAAITVAAVGATGTVGSNPTVQAFLLGASAVDAAGIVLTVSNDGGIQFPLGITTVTFSAADIRNIIGTASSTVTITDQTAPVITMSGTTPLTIAAGSTYLDAAATATDNVDGNLTANIVTTNNVNSGIPGTYTVNYNVSDAATNAATTVSRTVVVTDQTVPVINLSGLTPVTVAAGSTYVDAGATATDNIDGNVTANIVPTSTVNTVVPGAYNVTYNVSDAANNAAMPVVRVVNIRDQTVPVITMLGTSPFTVAMDSFYVDAGATASDNIDGNISANIVPTSNVNTATAGTYTVNYNVSDAAANAALQITRTVIVSDQTLPLITLLGTSPYTVAVGSTYVDAGATANDNVDGNITASIVTVNNVTTAVPAVFAITYDVSDIAGNAAIQVTRTVKVTDQAAPVITLTGATPITIAAGSNYIDAGATAVDNVDGNLSGNIVVTNSVNTATVGTYTVLYDVSDAAGNPAIQASRTVNVTDQTAPVVTAPANISITALNGAGTPATNAAITAFLTGATANDNISGNVPVSHSGLTSFPMGTTVVTFLATDGAANTGSATASITVTDLTQPVITVPANITVAAVDVYGTPASDPYIAAFLVAATANDNVDGAITPSNNAPIQFPLGITTVSFSATDVAGNTGTTNATVTIQNQSAPTVTAPANLSVAATNATGTAASDPYITAFLNGATAVDLLGNVLAVSINAPAQFPFGTTTVTFSATDVYTNIGTATATITVSDQTLPVVTAPAAITVAAVDVYGTPASDPYVAAFLNTATATDNVVLTPIISNDAAARLLIGTTTVIFSANDGYGNIGTASSTITITDLTAPVVTAPLDVYAEASAPMTAVTLGTAIAVDNVNTGLTATANNTGPFPVGLTIVTWSSTDAYGNVGTATQNVTIIDSTAPTLNIPADIYTEASAALSAVMIGVASANDLVSGVITASNNAPTAYPVGTNTITWSAIDANGNTVLLTQNVTVQDTTAPSLTVPVDVYVEATGIQTTVLLATATASDLVDGALIPTNNAAVNFAIGTTAVTWSVTDANGNTATAVQSIIVSDNTAPTLTLPADVYAEATAALTTVTLGTTTATDLVDGILTATNSAPASFPVGITLVTWTVSDRYANTATAVQRVVISDTTAPVLTLPADIYTEATGVQTTVAIGLATAVDLVSAPVTTTSDAPATFLVGTTLVTWSAVDAYTNTASANQNIVVQDTTPPTVTTAASITVAALNVAGTAASNATITAFLTGATATDLVNGNVVPTHNGLATFPIGITTVTFSAIDGKGNTGTANATVTIVDQTLPVVTAPANITVAAVDAYGTPASDPYIAAFLIAATANDNVDGAITPTNNVPAQFPLGVTTVTFSATDGYGNTGTATATVSIQNQSAPTVTAPTNITVAAVNASGIAASDPYITAFLNGAAAVDLFGNVLAVSNDGLVQFPLGTTTITFSATDVYTNTGTATATITVSDQSLPVVTVPAAIIVAAVDAYGTPAADPYITAFLNAATATDNVVLTPTITNDAAAQLLIGTTTVVFSANDGYGNIGTASSTVTVTDLAAPVVTAPLDVYTEATAPLTAVTLGTAIVVDNVNTGLTATANNPSPFPVGITIVTWSSTDAYGNVGTATQNVTITDSSAPTLNIPADIYTEASAAQSLVTIGVATANDLVFGLITATNNAPTTFPVATTTITWSAVDGYGNAISLTQKVTVQDSSAPAVIAPASITIAAVNATGTTANDATIAAFLAGATATDLVSGNIVPTHSGLATFPIGITTVTFSATDGKANIGTAIATVTVVDQTLPVVTAPANITVAAVDANGTAATDPYIAAFLNGASANDNVDGAIIPSNDAPTQLPIGVTTVTFSATDGYGNTGVATATVTVQNQTAPTVTAPANLLVAAVNASGTAANDPYIAAFLNGASAVDLLGNVLIVSNDGLAQLPLGTTTITFSATDAYTNSGIATAAITVLDQTPPVVIAPANISVLTVDAYGLPSTDPYISAFLAAASANDNVDGVITPTNNAPTQFQPGLVNVLFSATDAYGNTATVAASVTVNYQNIAPVITAPADPYALVVVEDSYASLAVIASDANGDSLAWDIYTAASNGTATVDPYGVVRYIGNVKFSGADTFTVRVTDGNGGVATLVVQVTVTPAPNTAPVAVADSFTSLNAQLVIYANAQATSSTFDGDTEGWTLFNDATALTHVTTGGNPGGYIHATDLGTGAIWAWQAPAQFLGDKSLSYGSTLSFDLKQSATVAQIAHNDDVTLIGNGVTLRYDTINNPAVSWTHYSLTLSETAGWIDAATGLAPSQATMQSVLASLTNLRIIGEYISGADVGSLDNVILGNVQPGLLSNDSDADGDTLTISAIDAVTLQGGTLTSNNNDTYSYQPAAGFVGTDSFNYTASDGQLTATATVTVTVVNNAFITTLATPLSVPADGVSISTVTANVVDSVAAPIVGKTVNFVSSSPYATLSAATAISDAAGNVSVTVTGTLIETATISSSAVTATHSAVDVTFNNAAADDDGDGLTNAFEFSIGTNPLDSDTDRDGFTDFQEVNATPATDPLNAVSMPTGAAIATPALIDLEADNGGLWSDDTLWQHGLPTTGPKAAYSGSNVWATNLTGNHTNSARAYLYMPLVSAVAANRALSMRIWATSWGSGDGTTVEVYDPITNTWTALPALITPYDQNNLGGSGNSGWGYAGYKAYIPANSADWALAAFDLSGYNGRQIQLRLAFRSSASLTAAGTYVDDIRLNNEANDPDADGITGVLSEWTTTATDPFLSDSDGDGALDGADAFPLNPAAGYVGAVTLTAPTLLDFEAGTNGVATDGMLWQHGAPTTGPGSAYGGLNGWATNGTGTYTNSAVEHLYIPSTTLATGSRTTLSMRIWASSWGSGDGTTVELYDVTLGRWIALHALITPYEASLSSGGELLPIWANQGTALAAFDLSRYAGTQVQLRISFRSSATLTADGFYVDDIRLDDETVDADGDGLVGVLDEYFTYRTDPFISDSDGDGVDDGTESAAGTNPLDAASYGNRVPTAGDFQIFTTSTNTLAQFEMDSHVADVSGNGRDAILIGGSFVSTEFGQGLHVSGSLTGINWDAYAGLIAHPYTIEMVLTPQNTSGWHKLFSFNDASDSGWYYRSQGFYAYGGGAVVGAPQLIAGEQHYLTMISTSSTQVDVYSQGNFLGTTNSSFSAPPAEAIFFRDDSGTSRGEQVDAIVEGLRISTGSRSAAEMQAIVQRLQTPGGKDYSITMNLGDKPTLTLTGTDRDSDPLNFKISTLPAAGALYQTIDGTTLGAQIIAAGTLVTNTSGRVIFVPVAGQLGQPYTSFSYIANDGTADSPAATVTINVVLNVNLQLTQSLSGTIIGNTIDLTAQLIDGYGAALNNEPLRFEIPANTNALFSANSLQTLDLYTDATGMAKATISDAVAENVAVTVTALNHGKSQVISQSFVANSGVQTVVVSTNSNHTFSTANGNCASIWTLAGSPYHVQSNVNITSGCSLHIDPYVVVKFDASQGLFVNAGGTLHVNGTTGAAVIFTSIKDDSTGGDSNGDGTATTPAAGNWSGIDFSSGSSGSVAFAQINYADTALYVRNASPTLNNLIANEFSLSGLYLRSYSGETTSPVVNNLVLTTTDSSNYPLYMKDHYNNGAVVAPVITGGAITTASTNSSYGAITLVNSGVNPTIAGMVLNGGYYSLDAQSGAGATLTGNTLSGAQNEAIYLLNTSTVLIDNSNTINNTPAPYRLNGVGMAGLSASIGAAVTDPYSVHMTGSFTAANTVLTADPLGTGSSVWRAVGNINVANGARLQLDPYTVIKFNVNGLYVQNGGTLDVYGTAAQPVIFTSIKDDTVVGDSNMDGNATLPAAGNWYGIDYESGSAGSISFAQVNYANTALYVRNASPTLNNVTANEFSLSGLYLRSYTSEVTSPVVNNLVLTTTDSSNYPIYMADYYNNGGIVAPVITGGSITTASTSASYGAITLINSGVNPTISGMTFNGGFYSLYVQSEAGATLTGNTLNGALGEAIYLSNPATVSINNSNTINNTPAPYRLGGVGLSGMSASMGVGITDLYSLHLTGSFTAENTVLGPDPLGTGSSVWQAIGNIYVANGARLQLDPYTVIKFNVNGLYVQNGGTLDLYGTAAQPVIFTSIKDDTVVGDSNMDGNATLPAAGNWYGVDYESGSIGSISFAQINYANTALYVRNASPTLNNVTVNEFSLSGLYLRSYTGEITSPMVNNLVLTTTDSSNYPIYMADYYNNGGIVAPVITGGIITTASTSGSYGAITLINSGVNPTISGMMLNGGFYSLYVQSGAGAILTSTMLNGAQSEGVHLSNAGTLSLNNSNTISNTPAPYRLTGTGLLGMSASMGVGITDLYSVHLSGSFTAANTVLGPDPLGTGSSLWQVVGSIYVANGARLQLDPYTVMKFNVNGLYVQIGGTLDIYGTAAQPVILTSIKDDTVMGDNNADGLLTLPAPGNWHGINYESGSTGSISFAQINFADHALYLRNTSPVLSNVTMNEFSVSGLFLEAISNEITNPVVSNLIMNTTDTNNYPLYMVTSGNGMVAPLISGGSITTSSTNAAYGAIHLSGSGTWPTISNMVLSGGAYSLYAKLAASATLSGNVLTGTLNGAVYLSAAGTVSINNSNSIGNTPLPYQLSGQLLPASISATLDAATTDIYSLAFFGTFSSGNIVLNADPLNTGASHWLQNGTITLNAPAVMDINAGSVFKVKSGSISVNAGASLNVNGTNVSPVRFTSWNDNSIGSPVNGSSGLPVRNEGAYLTYQAGSAGGMHFVEDYYASLFDVRSAVPINDLYLYDAQYGLRLYASSAISNLSIVHWGVGGGTALTIGGSTTIAQPSFSGINSIDKYTAVHPAVLVTGINAKPVFTGFTIDMHGNNHTALSIDSSASGQYNNNTIQNAGMGLTVRRGASAEISNNIIQNNSTGVELGWTNNTTYSPAVVTLTNNTIINNTANGIYVSGAAAGSIIEHNLIRGNGGVGVQITNITTAAITLRNNLIVENADGVQLLENAATLTGANATLQGNTIANNTAIGISIDRYSTASMTDNIIALNATADVLNNALTLSESYNLTADNSLSAGVGDIYANPLFAANWYLQNTSLAINANPLRTAASVGYLTVNKYAEASIQDTANLDLGYHHASAATLAQLQVVSEWPSGIATAQPVNISATLVDVNAFPVVNALVRIAIVGSPYANFTQNGLQSLDLYTDANGMVVVTLLDSYAELVALELSTPNLASTGASLNQLFADNQGVGTAITGTTLSGVSCNTTWDLSGSPYHVSGNVSVAAGCRLQIKPHVIVKFGNTASTVSSVGIYVNSGGRLDVQGQAGAAVSFTSVHDNSIGGTIPASSGTPAASNWGGIYYQAGSDGTMDYANISYGGYSTNYPLKIYASPVISNVAINNATSSLIYVNGASANPILNNITLSSGSSGLYLINGATGRYTNMSIDGASTQAIYLSSAQPTQLSAIAISNTPTPVALTGSAALPTGANIGITLASGVPNYASFASMTGSVRLIADPLNTGNSVWYIAATISVPAYEQLSIDPYAVIKFGHSSSASSSAKISVNANGILDLYGSLGAEVILTSIHDDYARGYYEDSNANGIATTPAATNWGGIYYRTGSDGSMDFVKISYAQSYPLRIAASPRISNLSISNSNNTLVYIHGVNTNPVLSNMSLSGGTYALYITTSATGSYNNINIDGATTQAIYLSDAQPLALTGISMNNTPKAISLDGSAMLPTGANVGFTLAAGVPDYAQLSSMSGAIRLGPDPMGSGSSSWYIASNITVGNGSSLAIDAYSVVKFGNTASTVSSAGISVSSGGRLDVYGSLGAEVLFNSIHDDYARGFYEDTNGNGSATTPAASNWGGIYYSSGSNGSMNHAKFAYGGYSSYSPLKLYASPVVNNISISNSAGNLIYVSGAAANPVVSNMSLTGGTTGLYLASSASGSYNNLSIDGPTTQAIYLSSAAPVVLTGININNTPKPLVVAGSTTLPTGANTGFTLGAGVPNYVQVSSLSGAVRFDPDPMKTGSSLWYVASNIAISSGSSLAIDAYTVVKFGSTISSISSAGVTVNAGGRLDAYGSLGAETIFTSIHDDYARGFYQDSNVNAGATTPAASNWGGIYYAQGSSGSMNNAKLHYAGYGGYYPLRIYASPVLNNISIDNSTGHLIYVSGATANPTVNNMLLTGGTSGLYLTNNASGSYNNLSIDGATTQGIYLSNASPLQLIGISMNNTAKPVVLLGSSVLPTAANLGLTLGAGVPNYALVSSLSGAVRFIPDPLGNGSSVWYISNNITIASGSSLAIDAYTVVTFGNTASTISSAGINVSSGARLDVYGSLGAEVLFSSIHDDYARGFYEDNNGNGAATIPAASNWGGIYYKLDSNGSINGAKLSYAGYSGYYPLRLYASPVINNVSINNSAGNLIYVSGATANPTVSNISLIGGTSGLYLTTSASGSFNNLSFDGATTQAIYITNAAPVDLTGISINNTPKPLVVAGSTTLPTGANIGFTLGASVPDYAQVTSLSGVVRFGPDPMGTGSSLWYVDNTISIPNGGSLAIEPYTVVKFGSLILANGFAGLYVANGGILDVYGALGAEVIFTSIHDDYARGYYEDSNINAAATIPAASNWIGVYYQSGSAGSMRNAKLRYSGYYYGSPLRLYASPVISDVSIGNSSGALVYVDGVSANPTLTNMSLIGGSYGLHLANAATGSYHNLSIDGASTQPIYIANASPTSLTAITINNTANPIKLTGSATLPTAANLNFILGAGVPDYVLLSTISGIVRLGPDPLTTGSSIWYAEAAITVPAGASLTIDAYTVVKFGNMASTVSSAGITVDAGGLLDIYGFSGAEVHLTSIHDDYARGYYEDSNGNAGATTPAAGNWGGIYFAPGSDGSVSDASLSYGGYAGYYPLRLYASPLIDNVSISNAAGYLVHASGATANPILNNLILNGGTYGVYADNFASITIRDSKIVNHSGAGIAYLSAGTYSIIERNIIRGNTLGITVSAVTTSPLSISNNLIVENSSDGLTLQGNTSTLTGANVLLQHNTIADNGGIGVKVATNASGSLTDNIIAMNIGGDVANLSTSISEDYNLTTDASLSAVNDLYADPLFTNGWYLQNASPAINADALRSAVTLFAGNSYSEVANADIGNLDLGYHHAIAAPLVSATLSSVVADKTTLAIAGLSTITVTPKDSAGKLLGSALKLTAAITAQGVQTGSISKAADLGNGSYTFTFTASAVTAGSDLISVTVNGVVLTQTVTITW